MADLRMVFAHPFFSFRNTRAIHHHCYQGFAVKRYSFTLAAAALNRSGACSIWVYTHVLNWGGKGVQSPGDMLFGKRRVRAAQ